MNWKLIGTWIIRIALLAIWLVILIFKAVHAYRKTHHVGVIVKKAVADKTISEPERIGIIEAGIDAWKSYEDLRDHARKIPWD